jgi:hypothetical protein
MRRFMTISVCLLTLGLLFTPSYAKALRIAVPNLNTPQKAIKAEVIVVGKVVEVEKDTVEASLYPGQPNKVAFQVGTIKINDTIQGAKGLTQIRVGWQPALAVNNEGNQGNVKVRPRPLRGGMQTISLTADQEGCFFLKKHHEADFYILAQFATPLDKKAENFDKEITQIKKILEILEKPMVSLKAKEAKDRHLAAGVLLTKYGTYPEFPNPKNQPRQEPIDAEESKLLLKSLSEMEIDPNNANPLTNFTTLFYMIQLTERDGWAQPKFDGQGDYNKIIKDAFDKWYKTHGEKFLIKRWVTSKK